MYVVSWLVVGDAGPYPAAVNSCTDATMRAYLLVTLLPLAFAVSLPVAWAEEAKDARSLEFELMLRGHPDLQYRMWGMEAFGRQDHKAAMTLFKRAARYGDKPSQGMIAELYAHGQGVEQDMALAYAWMDLAAERGYKDFVVRRERYWVRMDEATRQRALEHGQAIYAEYGDDVAKPRFADQLRRESKKGVGSRTGFAGNARIVLPSAFGEQVIDGTTLNRLDYWNPDQYWAVQDRLWRDPAGSVRVGGVESVAPAQPAKADAERRKTSDGKGKGD